MGATDALAALRAIPSGNLDQIDKEKKKEKGKGRGEESRIYLVSSTAGSELASAFGEQALSGLTGFATESPCCVQELLAALANVLSIHNGPNVARWAANMGGTGWRTILARRREIAKGT